MVRALMRANGSKMMAGRSPIGNYQPKSTYGAANAPSKAVGNEATHHDRVALPRVGCCAIVVLSGGSLMFGYFKRLLYRRKVLVPLYTLLYAYPPGPHRIMRDFHGLAEAIRQHQQEGSSISQGGALQHGSRSDNYARGDAPGVAQLHKTTTDEH